MNAPAPPFGQYTLVHKIADGGMGEIFLASDTQLNRPVAIKRVLEKFRTRPDVSRMFEAEATVMSVLRHPNIVRIFESGEVDGVFYISMEYIHGKTLRQLVDRAREVGEAIPPGLVVSIMSQLGDALGYAHEMKGRDGRPIGLVHRDVNPANLLIGYDGSVKLIDFGIVQTDDELAPEDLAPKGKFAYMSPEQTLGGRVDRRSDLFSLGICFYEALTLYNPFIHDVRGMAPVEAIREHTPAPLAQRSHRLAALDPLVSRLLAKDPTVRVDDAQVFIHELIQASEEAKLQPLIPLAAYMSDLFEEQKRGEDTQLEAVELTSHSTITIAGNPAPQTIAPPPLKAAAEETEAEELSEGKTEVAEAHAPVDDDSSEPLPQGSRVVFAGALTTIAVITALGAYLIYAQVTGQRLKAAVPPEPSPSRVATTDSDKADSDEDPNEDQPDTAPAAPEPQEPATPSVSTLRIKTKPAVRLTHQGERISKTEAFELDGPSGRLRIGLGRSPAFDPFAVSVDYAVAGERVTLTLRSTPEAAVEGPAGSLGQTPVEFTGDIGEMVFQLSRDRDRRELEVRLEFGVADPG